MIQHLILDVQNIVWSFCSLNDVMNLKQTSKWFRDIFLDDVVILRKKWGFRWQHVNNQPMQKAIMKYKDMKKPSAYIFRSEIKLTQFYEWIIMMIGSMRCMEGSMNFFYEKSDQFRRIDVLKFMWAIDIQNTLEMFPALWYIIYENDEESLDFILDPNHNFIIQDNIIQDLLDIQSEEWTKCRLKLKTYSQHLQLYQDE